MPDFLFPEQGKWKTEKNAEFHYQEMLSQLFGMLFLQNSIDPAENKYPLLNYLPVPGKQDYRFLFPNAEGAVKQNHTAAVV